MDGDASAVVEVIYGESDGSSEDIKYCMMDAENHFVSYSQDMHSHQNQPSYLHSNTVVHQTSSGNLNNSIMDASTKLLQNTNQIINLKSFPVKVKRGEKYFILIFIFFYSWEGVFFIVHVHFLFC